MATTQTTNLELYLPDIGGEEDNWGNLLNDNTEVLDEWSATVLLKANNLSDLANAQTARTNLGLGTAATFNDTRYLIGANNLSEINTAARKTSARANIEANNAANLTMGTLPGERLPAVTTSVSVAGSGNFTGGTLQFTQTGKLVNIQNTTSLTHATGSGPTSATTLIPSGLRPERPVSFVVSFSNSGLTRITISQGLLMLQYRDWSGAGRNETSFSENLNYTYRVA